MTVTLAILGAVDQDELASVRAKLPLCVDDFPGDDDIARCNAAWAYIKTRGGVLNLAPGKTYSLSAPWVLDVTSPVNIKIQGWGAVLTAGPSVAGPAVQVVGSYNEYLLDIEGLAFDHRGNVNVGGCIEVLGGHCVHIKRCTVEFHSTKAGYFFANFASSRSGDDWNSFWCKVEGCSTRKRSGAEIGTATYGIKLVGAVNAFTARDNTLSNCDFGVYAEPDPVTLTLPNAVVIEGNAFETIKTAAIRVQMTPARLGPTGWRVAFNRCEATPVFVSLLTGGSAASIHSQPPFLLGNYCTTGSVATWLENPSAYPVSSLESRFPGFAPAVDNELWQSGSMKLRFATNKHLYLQDAGGSLDFNRGNIVMANYHYWTNFGNGKFYAKAGAPTAPTDGQIVGTQA